MRTILALLVLVLATTAIPARETADHRSAPSRRPAIRDLPPPAADAAAENRRTKKQSYRERRQEIIARINGVNRYRAVLNRMLAKEKDKMARRILQGQIEQCRQDLFQLHRALLRLNTRPPKKPR